MSDEVKAAVEQALELDEGEKSLKELEEENARLRLELENARMRAEIDAINRGQVWSPEAGTLVGEPLPKGPGGAPVPRAPITPPPEDDGELIKGPPKQGDKVHVRCRSGAVLRSTGSKCTGNTQVLHAIINTDQGRRVTYVCQTCKQPWGINY